MPMNDPARSRVAILYPGDRDDRASATPENNRLASVFEALAKRGIVAEPAVYHDSFREEVRAQLMQVDAVLVWMNPIQDGRDRSVLDPMLAEVAATGIHVSAHPDVILKMGTKEVLYRTRDLGWGADTHLYRRFDQMRAALPARLAAGEVRVLKQYRGNGGLGVWKVALAEGAGQPAADALVRVRHAQRGSVEEEIPLEDFFDRCRPYFDGPGRVIDQEYQTRLPEGMVRCYLVHGKVVGFGLQAVNALIPAPAGAPRSEAPQPGPRHYHPPTLPAYQALKRKVEKDWVPAMQRKLDIDTASLPILWDCDFLFGPRNQSGEDTYVLCEINASSVAPYPESAPPFIAEAVLARLRAARQNRR
jgi:hypothetical protein